MMIVNNLLTVFVNQLLSAGILGFTKPFRSFSEKVSRTSEKNGFAKRQTLSYRQDLNLKPAIRGHGRAILKKKRIFSRNMLAAQDVRQN